MLRLIPWHKRSLTGSPKSLDREQNQFSEGALFFHVVFSPNFPLSTKRRICELRKNWDVHIAPMKMAFVIGLPVESPNWFLTIIPLRMLSYSVTGTRTIRLESIYISFAVLGRGICEGLDVSESVSTWHTDKDHYYSSMICSNLQYVGIFFFTYPFFSCIY